MKASSVENEEAVAWIDESDEVKSVVPRSLMRSRNLLHRAVYVLVWDPSGRIFVHQRSFQKDVYPGFWDLCITGVPRIGESYEEAARRELQEEIGVVDARITELFSIRYQDAHTNVLGRVYSCGTSARPVIQESEIVDGFFVDQGRLPELLAAEKFCPDGLEVWQRFTRALD